MEGKSESEMEDKKSVEDDCIVINDEVTEVAEDGVRVIPANSTVCRQSNFIITRTTHSRQGENACASEDTDYDTMILTCESEDDAGANLSGTSGYDAQPEFMSTAEGYADYVTHAQKRKCASSDAAMSLSCPSKIRRENGCKSVACQLDLSISSGSEPQASGARKTETCTTTGPVEEDDIQVLSDSEDETRSAEFCEEVDVTAVQSSEDSTDPGQLELRRNTVESDCITMGNRACTSSSDEIQQQLHEALRPVLLVKPTKQGLLCCSFSQNSKGIESVWAIEPNLHQSTVQSVKKSQSSVSVSLREGTPEKQPAQHFSRDRPVLCHTQPSVPGSSDGNDYKHSLCDIWASANIGAMPSGGPVQTADQVACLEVKSTSEVAEGHAKEISLNMLVGSDDIEGQCLGGTEHHNAGEGEGLHSSAHLSTSEVEPSGESTHAGFPLSVKTLHQRDFLFHLKRRTLSEDLLIFLQKSEEKLLSFCPCAPKQHTGRSVGVVGWGNCCISAVRRDVVMVLWTDVIKENIVDHTMISSDSFLNKDEYPCVWGSLSEKERKQLVECQRLPKRQINTTIVSLAYLAYVLEEYLVAYTTVISSLKQRKLSTILKQPASMVCPYTHNVDCKGYKRGWLCSSMVSERSSLVPKVPEASVFTDLSRPLIYPECCCSELSPEDDKERKAWQTSKVGGKKAVIRNLGLLRFMGKNVFTFEKQEKLYMSVAELFARGLLPSDKKYKHIVQQHIKLLPGKEVRVFQEPVVSFIHEYFDGSVDDTFITPFGLQCLYRHLSTVASSYHVYVLSPFYKMRLGHHCYWTLQVTPPTTQLHQLSDCIHPEGKVELAVMILVPEKESGEGPTEQVYLDGGGGTPSVSKGLPDCLLVALTRTIEDLGLKDIAEPFCSCPLWATHLASFRPLTICGVTLHHVTEMSFAGHHHLHCWKRNNGLFVSLAELCHHSLIPDENAPPEVQKIFRDLLTQATVPEETCPMMEFEQLFLKWLKSDSSTLKKGPSESGQGENRHSASRDEPVRRDADAGSSRTSPVSVSSISKEGDSSDGSGTGLKIQNVSSLVCGKGTDDDLVVDDDSNMNREAWPDLFEEHTENKQEAEEVNGSSPSTLLISLLYLHKMYESLHGVASELAKTKFRIKHWQHACPEEQSADHELPNVVFEGQLATKQAARNTENRGNRHAVPHEAGRSAEGSVDRMSDSVAAADTITHLSCHTRQVGDVTGHHSHDKNHHETISMERWEGITETENFQDQHKHSVKSISNFPDCCETSENGLADHRVEGFSRSNQNMVRPHEQMTVCRKDNAHATSKLSRHSVEHQQASRAEHSAQASSRSGVTVTSDSVLKRPTSSTANTKRMAWLPSTSNGHQHKLVASLPQNNSKNPHHFNEFRGESAASSYLAGEGLPQACSCPEREPSVLDCISILQCVCTFSEATGAEFLRACKNVGQAIIHEHFFWVFKRDNKIFFSIFDLKQAGFLHPGVGKAQLKYAAVQTSSYSEMKFMEGIMYHWQTNIINTTSIDTMLISAEVLCNLSNGSDDWVGPRVRPQDIFMHKVGHICSDARSVASVTQQKGEFMSDMPKIHKCWVASFRWQEMRKPQKPSKPITVNIHRLILCQKCVSRLKDRQWVSPSAIKPDSCNVEAKAACQDQPSGSKNFSEHETVDSLAVPTPSPCFLFVRNSCLLAESRRGEAARSQVYCWLKLPEADDIRPTAPMGHLDCEESRPFSSFYVDKELSCAADRKEIELAEFVEAVLLKQNLKMVQSIDGQKSLCAGLSQTHTVVLTGVMQSGAFIFRCLKLNGRLFLNWGECLETFPPYHRCSLYWLARRMHIYLYYIPHHVAEHLCWHYGGKLSRLKTEPWVCEQSLYTIYHWCTLHTVNENHYFGFEDQMLRVFINAKPENAVFPTFCLIKKK